MWRFLRKCLFVSAGLGTLVAAGWLGYLLWPRELGYVPGTSAPVPVLREGRLALLLPAEVVVADVGAFDDEVDAFLQFEYLRTRRGVDAESVLLTATEARNGSRYRMFLVVNTDLLTAAPYLGDLRGRDLIDGYELEFWTQEQLRHARRQSMVFATAHSVPAHRKLETLRPAQLLPALARFVSFKSKTDARVRDKIGAPPQPLSREAAQQIAADMIAVADFYALPLDLFLGIAAMENNYMDVPGDLNHAVWKRRAEKGDIILKRSRRGVLVRNSSRGVWQITRETLRHAHRLYLRDTRDYSALPERLRPPQRLDLESLDSQVLTTYAGLLFRDLLDRFDGDAEKAVGAYNGGARSPNAEYAAGVKTVAEYARKILEHAAIWQGEPASESFVEEPRPYATASSEHR